MNQPLDQNREPTPPEAFFDRRSFLKAAAVGALVPQVACTATPDGTDERILAVPFQRPDVFPATRAATPALPAGVGTTITPRRVAASHNNFYEFLPGYAGEVWKHTDDFIVEPWTIEVSGECVRPQTFDLDDLFKIAHEERLYHFRCVERWAMNVPWTGFPLSTLLAKVEPTDHARFVRFESAERPKQMPGLGQSPEYPWPYHEALRIDEAMHELTLMVTGVYGQPLLKQHGAPARIIVPWKYGYKSPKSIVKITLGRTEPRTFWQLLPHEYGFLSNVNPNIPHPRWSQSRSFWVDRRSERFPTPIFNGYGAQVAHLYPDEPTTMQRPLKRGEIAR